MYAWLIGILVGLAALSLGYAAVGVGALVIARAQALGLWRRPGMTGRRLVALGRYRPRLLEEPLVLPPALAATLSVLRRPSPTLLFPAAAGLALAALAHDGLLSPYLVGLGASGSLYLAYRQTLRARQGIGDEVLRLVDAFVGLYRVNPATMTTLTLAAGHLREGPVRAAALAAVRHYETTRDLHAALQRLAALDDPYLTRFVLILDQAGEQSPGEIGRLLADLQARLRRRWTTRLAAQGTFAALRGTLAVLTGALCVVIAVGVTIPLWREIHTASVVSRLAFIGLTTTATLAVAFFDRRMRLDEETLL